MLINQSIPRLSAKFQIDQRLYVSGGGVLPKYGDKEFISDLFSIDYSGRCTKLQPMKKRRDSFSLSGSPSELIAIGGVAMREVVTTCETFLVSLNKVAPRGWPGSILLQSRRAYCFGGFGRSKRLSSIEAIRWEWVKYGRL